jgi:hypothetical protein
MKDFTFKVNLIAVVRVRAADESAARQVVSDVLGTPGNSEIELINQKNTAAGHDATITRVDFAIGQIKASKVLEKRAKLVALAKSWRSE